MTARKFPGDAASALTARAVERDLEPGASATEGAPSASAADAAGVVMDAVPFAMRSIRREMRAGRDPSLSVPQFRALLYLRREPNSGLGATADHLGITAGAASELVDRLVRQGLVERETDPRERRRVRLRLTEHGADQLQAAQLRTRTWLAAALAQLDPGRLERLVVALGDLRTAIEAANDTVGADTMPNGGTETVPVAAATDD